jgi:ribosomal protein S18 acetylase RimI-like enzyme
MFRQVSKHQLLIAIVKLRSAIPHSKVVSNYFDSSLEGEEILLAIQNKSLYFLKKDLTSGLYYYFFIAESGFLLPQNLDFPAGKVVSEQVFKHEVSKEIVDHFSFLGFEVYAQLRKMSLLKKEVLKIDNQRIHLCNENDVRCLRSIFDLHFDPISERYPSDIEILAAVRSKSVFKFVSGDQIIGFYWADTKKILTELRYIYVCPTSRGSGIGKELFEHHLYMSQRLKKNQLWVLQNNFKAIGMYEKYGYSFEGLEDIIFIRGKM